MHVSTLSPQEQRKLLDQFLASDAVRDRPEGIQRDHDDLIRRCVDEEEISLAMALWAVMAFRTAGIPELAASELLSLYTRRDVRSRAQAVLGEDRVN